MKARVGDRLVMESTHLDDPRRVGVITDVPHPDGSPPYQVHWLDGHETLVFPGPDARVQRAEPAA